MTRLAFVLLGVLTALVFLFSPGAAALGCEECLPGGDCTWYDCTYQGEGCYSCSYSCPGEQHCSYSTCWPPGQNPDCN